jgi:iron complex transport system ATP-binding protein
MGRFPYMRWYQRLQASDKSVIAHVLELTKTYDLLHKRLTTLSDGQLQKVMIARALVQDTPIVLLDEPTAHLDLPNRFMIFQLLRDLAKQMQKAILVATHDLEPCLQTADQMWLLDKGVCYVGLPEMLVLEGVIGRVFGNDSLQYDALHDTFQLQQTPLAYVQLTGEGIAHNQTRKAFARLGVGINTSAAVHIRVLPTATGCTWEWVGKDSFETLESLLEKLALFLFEKSI